MKLIIVVLLVLALLATTALALDCETWCCWWDIGTETCRQWCTKCR